jgi:hypothetical protein
VATQFHRDPTPCANLIGPAVQMPITPSRALPSIDSPPNPCDCHVPRRKERGNKIFTAFSSGRLCVVRPELTTYTARSIHNPWRNLGLLGCCGVSVSACRSLHSGSNSASAQSLDEISRRVAGSEDRGFVICRLGGLLD